MRRHVMAVLVVALLSQTFVGPAVAQSTLANPQPLQLNVLLSEWQVLGPFPKRDPSRGGTYAEYTPDDRTLTPDHSVTYQGQTYEWKPWDRRVVDFRRALDVSGEAASNAVAYAWTSFHSDVQGPAVLAIGHDDSVAVWLNGTEVHRDDTAATSCFLDQVKLNVQLQAGTNTLLLKIGQGAREWETLARILPAGASRPTVVLGTNRSVGGDMTRVPVLDVELLNASGQVLQRLHASGFRHQSPGGLQFTGYAADLPVIPAAVRVSYQAQHLQSFSQQYSWQDVQGGKVRIPILADRPFAGQVVSRETGQGIADAEFWLKQTRSNNTSRRDGSFRLTHLNPLGTEIWVAAPGFAAERYELPWPWPDTQTIRLQPGGKVLKGTVTTADGQPIGGARIRSGLYSGYQPVTTTNDRGEFRIVSIPEDKQTLFPVLVRDGFASKDRFSVELDQPVTTVHWDMQRAGVARGQVTLAATGAPLAGITVTAGSSRFASNIENPQAKTDAEGRYVLRGIPPGQTVLHAFSDNHAPAIHEYTASADSPVDVNFTLTPGQAVTGRITDPDGAPVAGVWLVTDTWQGLRMFRRETHTNSDGYFSLEHMPEPATEVHVLKQDYVSIRNLVAAPGKHYEITLQPVVEHQVRPRLADSDKPVQNLQIQKGYQYPGQESVSWRDRSSETRNYDPATGIFRIRNDEPSTAQIFWRFRFPGYQDVVIQEPDAQQKSQQLDVVLQPATTFSGRVVSAETAEPLANIAVALVSPQDRLRVDHYVDYRLPWTELQRSFTGVHTVTEADGTFTLPRPADLQGIDIVVTASQGGFQYFRNLQQWLSVSESDDAAAPEVLLPFAEPARISGRVTVAGQPAAGERLHVAWQPDVLSSGESAWDLPFGVGGQVTCDADGNFSIPGLGAGTYQINRVRAFSRPGGGGISLYMDPDNVTVLPGETLVHNIDQPAGISISGQTLDPQGQPLDGCVIEVQMTGDQGRRLDAVRTDAQGYFTIDHLPEAELDLTATHYSSIDASACGLGGEDFRGRQSITLPDDSHVVLTLSAVHGNSLTNSAKLAGSVPPDFTARPLDSDTEFTLSDNWGKVVAIDFWATWCGPCMADMPTLKALHQKYQNRDDVLLLTVSLDEDEDRLRKVLSEQGLDFPVLFSGRGWDDAVSRAFGVTGIPSSFVIGRDGRFAAERVRSSGLEQAIQEALAQPVDPLYASGVKPGRLTVGITVDDTDLGLPHATLTLRATSAAGTIVREDELPVPGLAPRMTWLYPPVPNGTLTATITAPGVETQSQQLTAPSTNESLQFNFVPVRSLTGVVATTDGIPAVGVAVTAAGTSGFRKTATSDETGRFELRVMPGAYQVNAAATAELAPVEVTGQQVTVPADRDPGRVSVTVCPTLELTGTVIGTDGQPVADATVQIPGSQNVKVQTDDSGTFRLPGVPSQGERWIYAFADDLAGAIRLSEVDRTRPVEIIFGRGIDRGSAPRKLYHGQSVPELQAQTLDGTPLDWSPTADHNRLLVFCDLASPASRDFVRQAAAWADRQQTTLQIFSTDWGRGIADLALQQFDVAAPVAWVGPSTLRLDKRWGPGQQTRTVLISSTGIVLAVPEAGELPAN